MNSKAKIFIAIFLLALLVRVLYLEQIKNTFLFYHPIVDSGAFETIGSNIASGRVDDGAVSGRIPLYRNFIAIIYKAVGQNPYFTRFIQSVLGALSCGFLFLLACYIFKRSVGIIAGVIASFYWPLIAFESKFLPVTLAIFFSMLMLLCIYEFLEKKKILWLLPSGALLALTV